MILNTLTVIFKVFSSIYDGVRVLLLHKLFIGKIE